MISIGIELEGTDTLAYTDAQYQQLAAVTRTLIACYPAIADTRPDTATLRLTVKRTLAPFDWPRCALVALRHTSEMT